jgi:acetyl-CoA C-acetyltransferase
MPAARAVAAALARSAPASRAGARAMSFLSADPARQPVIVSAVRTPIGSFGGSLAGVKAPALGAAAIKGALEKADVPPEYVQEVLFGNVCQAGVGQAPARQASMGAGLPQSTVATTVNKVCASGMKTVSMAAMGIACGINDVVMAGGMESMSNVPYLIEKARFGGYRYGNGSMVDGLVHDGLWDPYGDHHMGICAEKCANQYNITREDQDAHVEETYRRTIAAIEAGYFTSQITPVSIPGRSGSTIVSVDEEPLKVKIDKISKLKPAFKREDGSVTAANSSSINDGAAALLVMSAGKAKELGLSPIAKVVGFADAEQAPIDFTTAPSLAVPKALKMAGMEIGHVDLWELNQAFSVVSIANQRILDLDPAKVDVTGGAVVLGHPIGCSGARILVTLLHNLIRTGKTVGAAGICNGGGGASAIVLERM